MPDTKNQYILLFSALLFLTGGCFETDPEPGVSPTSTPVLDCADEEVIDAELCDGLDNDCDGQVDEEGGQPWYVDNDGDGFGDGAQAQTSCDMANNGVRDGSDCDDDNAGINPEAEEACNGLDDDCDGLHELLTVYYLDYDGDGYGVADYPLADCLPPEQTSLLPGDCDDQELKNYPHAAESCDLKDNDCDGLVDEQAQGIYFVDSDGDGFGDESISPVCVFEEALTLIRGDCNDADASIHPGAEDDEGDDLDQDCGGADGAQPHVGLTANSFSDIQSAIEQSADGQSIWVGPGIYESVELSTLGKAIKLRSTSGPSQTSLLGFGPLINIYQGEGANTVIEGFKLSGALAGAMAIQHSSPTLRNLTFEANTGESGGALRLQSASVIAEGCQFFGNTATLTGGAIALLDTSLVLSDSLLMENATQAGPGGAIHGLRSSLTLVSSQLTANESPDWGGAIYIDDSGFSGESSYLQGNRASIGGGVWLRRVQTYLQGSVLAGNVSEGLGGGLYSTAAELNLTNNEVLGNYAAEGGGGLYFTGGNGIFDHLNIALNGAGQYGGGLAVFQAYLTGSQLIWQNNRTVSEVKGLGGGLYINDSGVDLSHFLIDGSVASGREALGAGVYVYAASPFLSHFVISGSRSAALGGAFASEQASASLYHGIFYGNSARGGGALALLGASSPGVHGSILEKNTPNNLHLCCENEFGDFPAPYFSNSSLLLEPGAEDYNPPWMDDSNVQSSAHFLAPSQGDWHLALTSPLVDGGWSGVMDQDSSVEDLGIYGEEAGAMWDLDGDGLPAYFWPGDLSDTPPGVIVSLYDCDDRDKFNTACSSSKF